MQALAIAQKNMLATTERRVEAVEREQKAALNRFLADVEKRAYRIAYLGTSQREEALDIVQDAMFGFARRYVNKPQEQWPPLFYKVLNSRLYDWYRRNAVRRRWMTLTGRVDDNDRDPVESAPDVDGRDPSGMLVGSETADALDVAVAALPQRQRQAFLLRTWEGFSVAETSVAMGCGQGSVKTHLSRAMSALRKTMTEHR